MFQFINTMVIAPYQHYRAKQYRERNQRIDAMGLYADLIAAGDAEAVPLLFAFIQPNDAYAELILIRAYLRKHQRFGQVNDIYFALYFARQGLYKGNRACYTALTVYAELALTPQQWLGVYVAGLSIDPPFFLDKVLRLAMQSTLDNNIIIEALRRLDVPQLFPTLPVLAQHPEFLYALGHTLMHGNRDEPHAQYAGFFLALAAKHGSTEAIALLESADDEAIVFDAIRYYYLPLQRFDNVCDQLVILIQRNYAPAIALVMQLQLDNPHYLTLAERLHHLNQHALSMALLEKASQNASAVASYQLGNHYLAQGETDTAWRYYYLALQGEHPDALSLLDNLYAAETSPDLILDYARRIAAQLRTQDSAASGIWMLRAVRAGDAQARQAVLNEYRDDGALLWQAGEIYLKQNPDALMPAYEFMVQAANADYAPAIAWQHQGMQDPALRYAMGLYRNEPASIDSLNHMLYAYAANYPAAVAYIKTQKFTAQLTQYLSDAFAQGNLVARDTHLADYFLLNTMLRELSFSEYERAHQIDNALALFVQASALGSALASIRCAEIHRDSSNYPAVWHYLVLALQQGDRSALHEVEKLYVQRASVDKDRIISTAYEIAKIIADSHVELSDTWMYRAIAAGSFPAKKTYAHKKSRDGAALWWMAQRLRKGIVTAESVNNAYYFSILAADAGYAPAQEWLAERIAQEDGLACYAKAQFGKHTKYAEVDDYLLAIRYGCSAALAHLKTITYADTTVYHTIAQAFEKGEAVPKDMAVAQFFYLKGQGLDNYAVAQLLEHPQAAQLPGSIEDYMQLLFHGNAQAETHVRRNQHALNHEQRQRIVQHYRNKGCAYDDEARFWQQPVVPIIQDNTTTYSQQQCQQQ